MENFSQLFLLHLGLIGSMFLALGVLKLTPYIMAELSTTKWLFNERTLENITSQKADFICGIVFIFFAFIIQLVTLLVVPDSIKVSISYWKSVIIALSLPIIFLITMVIIHHSLVEHFGVRTRIEFGRKGIKENIDDKKISKYDFDDISGEAKLIFNIEKEKNESQLEFLKRYCERLEIHLPEDIDLHEVQRTEEVK